MPDDPTWFEYLYATLHEYPVVLFFAIHLTIGRTFSLLAGLMVGLHPLALIGLAWIGDMLNIPFFVTIYELSSRGLRLSPVIRRWLDRGREHLERRRIYRRFRAMGTAGVIALAATPMWGCGMWSAIFLAWSMRMNRVPGTVCLSIGSLIGSAIVLTLAGGVWLVLRAF